MIVPGMFVCGSFLISVRMFIVSKALLISSATVIVRAGEAVWLNPFATVLFSVGNAVTVEFCTRVAWVYLVCLMLCKEEGYSPVSLQILRGGIWGKLLDFTLFYCLLDMRSGECDVVSLYVVCCSVNGFVCFMCCVFDSVCELSVMSPPPALYNLSVRTVVKLCTLGVLALGVNLVS